MGGLAPDHAAERHEAVEPVEREIDGGRDLESARHLDPLPGGADLGQRRFGALHQQIGDIAVEPRLDNEDVGRAEFMRAVASIWPV